MLNKCTFIGNLGKIPETKTVGDSTVCNFSLAMNEKWKDKSGEDKEKTEWVNVVCWGKLADIVSKYLTKGSKAYVEGKLTTRSWEDKNGEKRYTTEIVASSVLFLDSKPSTAKSSGSSQPSFDSSEEIPF